LQWLAAVLGVLAAEWRLSRRSFSCTGTLPWDGSLRGFLCSHRSRNWMLLLAALLFLLFRLSHGMRAAILAGGR